MYEQIINSLRQSGWSLVTLEGSWVSATHESLNRGLMLGDFSELPNDFRQWISYNTNIPKWDVIVFCPDGIDSSYLKERHFPGIQLWYWDMRLGNLFPFPPTNDQLIPQWLKQLASGKPVLLEKNSRIELSSKPFLTYAIIGINIIYFLMMVFSGFHLFPNPTEGSIDQRVLIDFGAKVNSLIEAGEIWRFFSSTFIHIGIIHLAFNLYALWALGPLSEESFGHRRFFMIYILSGLGGSIASFFFSPVLSAGASGAIFGLLGALLYYSYKRPALWKSGLGMNLVVVILINLGFGFVQPGIDNFAHLGGLITGTLTCFLSQKRKNK
ncbi:rhomboid family intramembrane serine protease [Desulfosporosinus fructosivorans]|uniref:Rhomboid family intramembrane serine protease n=1 Tax=Desulfosporosinus fructosivorans TaxID=2018669 RepID=A0A4Z0R491_9FIRM|nr:rhomboid family intramembrane serine protease [Desulfosporosinus fructosivorans]TGE36993.1 rhomboid family intramembrane serine protease [Desulfosporosinus fructosivorans]